jgi:hypothetical protein
MYIHCEKFIRDRVGIDGRFGFFSAGILLEEERNFSCKITKLNLYLALMVIQCI